MKETRRKGPSPEHQGFWFDLYRAVLTASQSWDLNDANPPKAYAEEAARVADHALEAFLRRFPNERPRPPAEG